jgi:hypothetical protein
MIENLKLPIAGLTLFPTPEAVFAAEHTYLAKHILPLVSIDLSLINPDWGGVIHMVSPLEPYDGYMGEYTQAYHNAYCKENWLAFRLNASNQYEPLTDRRYFFLENSAPPTQAPEGLSAELAKHYESETKAFEFSKLRFQKFGGLYGHKRFDRTEKNSDQAQPWNILDQLGGNALWGNWSSYPEPPAEFSIDESDSQNVIIENSKGDRLFFVARVPAYHYTEGGADTLLFYEPSSRTALFTFDFT